MICCWPCSTGYKEAEIDAPTAQALYSAHARKARSHHSLVQAVVRHDPVSKQHLHMLSPMWKATLDLLCSRPHAALSAGVIASWTCTVGCLLQAAYKFCPVWTSQPIAAWFVSGKHSPEHKRYTPACEYCSTARTGSCATSVLYLVTLAWLLLLLAWLVMGSQTIGKK